MAPGVDRVKRAKKIFFVLGCLLAFTGLVAGESAADWEVYVSGGLGISGIEVDTDGIAPGIPDILQSGQASDASPLVDGAVGLAMPMDELIPRELLADIRLPNWPVRFEMEAAGLREYEVDTVSGGQAYYSKIQATTLMWNIWNDIPMIAILKPVQYTFGLGRQPRLRQWLEPGSIYYGVGVGLGVLEFRGSDNVLNGADDIYDFAWNAGIGVNYAITDAVDLSVGYRYVGIGKQKVDLFNGFTPQPNASLEYDNHIHELRIQFRVAVFEFLSPWR